MPLACSMARVSRLWLVSRAKSAKPTAIVTTTMPSTARRIRAARVLPSRGMRLLVRAGLRVRRPAGCAVGGAATQHG